MFSRFSLPVFLLLTPVLRAQTTAASAAPPDAATTSASPVVLAKLTVTTATRTARVLEDVPVRTEVILREDIELRSTLNFSHAVELLNGLRVESNCQNCNTSDIQLLGLSGAYNQILFDGAPLLSALGGVYGIEQIPAAFVDRIEVVKGGGSALYGPGAVAGVINLIPASPRGRDGFVEVGVEWQKGSPLFFAATRANTVLADGKLGLSFVGQGARNDASDFNGDGFSELTAKELSVAGTQAWFVPTRATRIRANYQYTRESRRGGNRLDQPEYLANIAESLDTKYHRGGVAWEQNVSPEFDFHAGYSFAHIERGSFYGGLGDVVTDPRAPGYDPQQLDPAVRGSAAATSFNQYGFTRNPLYYFDTQFNWRRGAHALAFGVQHKRESVRDQNRDFTGARRRVTADDTYRNTGGFVQDEWKLSPALDLVLGSRLDKSSVLDDAILSPRVAAAFSASDRLKFRAGVSTGFRAPEIFSEDLHVDTLGAEQVRTRNAVGLTAERARTASAGFDWRSRLVAPRWAFDATASVTDIRDTFVLGEIETAADGSLSQTRGNAAGSRIDGLETNFFFRPVSALRLTAGAAYFRSRFETAEVVFDDTGGGGTTVIATRRYLKTPDWSAVAQAAWTPNERFEAFAGLKYTGRMQALNNTTGTLNRTPAFYVADLGFKRHFWIGRRQLDWSVGVKNVFDQRQRDLETGANRDSDYVYGPRFARSFSASLRCKY